MKKLILIVFIFTVASSLGVNAQINIASGPSVRIPGITVPTVLQLLNAPGPQCTGAFGNPDRAPGSSCVQIRWLRPDRTIRGTGVTFSTTEAGIYTAVAVQRTRASDGMDIIEEVSDQGTFEIPAFAHSISVNGPNPLNPPTTTDLCITSNAQSYITNIVWQRGPLPEGSHQICRGVLNPGVYTAQVTYSYAPQSTTIQTSSIYISPAGSAPSIALSSFAYNPVVPPVMTIFNATKFDQLQVFLDGALIATFPTVPTTYLIPNAGVYSVSGSLKNNGGTAVASDVYITKGNIPVPTILAPARTLLTYNNPSIQIETQNGYNSGYTWYLDGNQLGTGSSVKTFTLTKPGAYNVKGCANYPDGTSQCQTSPPMQITGEVLYINSVKTKAPLIEGITDPSQLDALPSAQMNISTVFADGFARPVQDVQKAVSPLGKDIVLLHSYDQFGRVAKQFLPYVRQSSDGAFNGVPSSGKPVLDFYRVANDKIADTPAPFADTRFEASILSRVLSQGAPGEEWQLDNAVPHVKNLIYGSNRGTDKIWIWSASAGLSASAYYPDGVLTITESIDEDGKSVKEFKDKSDHTVLIEKAIEGGVKLRTYFVYDDFGMNTHVIPPKTVAALPDTPTANIANDVIARECFRFQYDVRGRATAKDVPGGGSTYFVYDKWDRVVLTQNANQRSHSKWSFVKFDARNRAILTGEITMTGDNIAAAQTINSFYSTVSSNPSLRYEDRGSNIHGYTNRSFPVLTNEFQVYTASYFDDYGFLPQPGTAYRFTPEPTLGLTASASNTQTLLTGMKAIVLGTHTYLQTINYYDQKGRLIQVISDNYLGGVDRNSNAFDFTGKITKVRVVHNGLQVVTIDKDLTYDAQGRKLKTYQSIDNGPRILLCDYHYNELGQVVEKNIHSADENKFLQSLDYTYNIRGWLSQVNPTETETNVTYADQFGFELNYNTSSAAMDDFKGSFNGNISAYVEVMPGLDISGARFKNAFNYHYDARNQLVQATYYQFSNPSKNGAFDVPTVTYDQNGNILTLKRKGITQGGTPGLIDDLNYTYRGNQLLQVNDLGDQVKGFINK